MSPKNPMPLDELPEYLKSKKSNGSSPVVDMGTIVTERSHTKQFIFAALMFFALGAGGMITYDLMSTKQLTVVLDTDSGAGAIEQIVADSGGQVLSVTQTEDSVYEVEVITRKSRHSFLEWLRKSKDVKKAELEE